MSESFLIKGIVMPGKQERQNAEKRGDAEAEGEIQRAGMLLRRKMKAKPIFHQLREEL